MNKKILFGGILVLVFSFTGCDQVTGNKPESVALTTVDFNTDGSGYATFTTQAARSMLSEVQDPTCNLKDLKEVLKQLPENTNKASTPAVIKIDAINISDNWANINKIVKDAKKYIILDLSDCTANNNTLIGEDQPQNNDFNIIKDNTYIKGIIIPDSVTNIGNTAFAHCVNLTSITIPDTVTSIGENAFGNCSSLISVTFNGNTGIGQGAFTGCSSLGTVTFKGNPRIGQGAFTGCSSLSIVTFKGNPGIGQGAFTGCSSIYTIKFEGDGNSSIGQDAFTGCSSISTITFNGNPSIGQGAFTGCSSLKTITFKGNPSIGEGAFTGCSSLKTITFKGDSSIGQDAFAGCSSLNTMTFKGNTGIGQGAFADCLSLKSITFGGEGTYLNIKDNIFPQYSNFLFEAGGVQIDSVYLITAGTYELIENNSGSGWRRLVSTGSHYPGLFW